MNTRPRSNGRGARYPGWQEPVEKWDTPLEELGPWDPPPSAEDGWSPVTGPPSDRHSRVRPAPAPRPVSRPRRVDGFAKLPRWLVGADVLKDLSPGTAKVLIAMIYHTNSRAELWPSVPTLCREAGVSRPTAQKAIRELKSAGLIRPVGVTGRNVVRYRVATEVPVKSSKPADAATKQQPRPGSQSSRATAQPTASTR